MAGSRCVPEVRPPSLMNSLSRRCRRRRRIALGVALALGILSLDTGHAQLAKARAALDRVHTVGRMRFFYATQGPHAVSAADANGNGLPDQVEDIATQTRAAWLLFIDALGFPDPFLGDRFRAARYLDVHLISKDVLKSNGVAYDEIQRYNRKDDPAGAGSLCFNVATSVHAPANLTPAHEFFHLIQYGATYFKNSWYLEGMARWSEKGLGQGGAGTGLGGAWPPAAATWEKIDELSYNACAQLWDPLAKHLDPTGDLPADQLPTALRDLKYVNGDPVLKDLKLHGWRAMRQILQDLAPAHTQAAHDRHLDRWSESEQRNKENTPLIRKVVEGVGR